MSQEEFSTGEKTRERGEREIKGNNFYQGKIKTKHTQKNKYGGHNVFLEEKNKVGLGQWRY